MGFKCSVTNRKATCNTRNQSGEGLTGGRENHRKVDSARETTANSSPSLLPGEVITIGGETVQIGANVVAATSVGSTSSSSFMEHTKKMVGRSIGSIIKRGGRRERKTAETPQKGTTPDTPGR